MGVFANRCPDLRGAQFLTRRHEKLVLRLVRGLRVDTQRSRETDKTPPRHDPVFRKSRPRKHRMALIPALRDRANNP